MTELKRQLGLLDSTMINVGTIIASAIFIVPSVIALNLGASLPTILVWVVGGAESLLGALSAAELGAAMRSEEHTSELQSPCNLVCRLLLEKKKKKLRLYIVIQVIRSSS